MGSSSILPVYMVHWNAPDWAGSAARSILASEGVQVELTVIDNPSERSAELPRHLPAEVKILRSDHNGGYTGGANLALKRWLARHDGAPFCVICSHDLHLQPDALREMLEALQSHPSYGVLEPTLWHHEPKRRFLDARPLREVQWACGCCLMLRRSAVQGVFFDERFGSYVEDVDFCLRVADAGHKIGWATQAVAWELGSASQSAGVKIKANTVRLKAKRGGWINGATAATWLALHGVRSAVAALAPWRTRERRLASRRECADSCRALAAVVRPGFWSPGVATVQAIGDEVVGVRPEIHRVVEDRGTSANGDHIPLLNHRLAAIEVIDTRQQQPGQCSRLKT